MPSNRFFFEETFHQGQIITLEGDEFHHLSHATRKRPGESVELINGMGMLATGVLTEIKKNAALISIQNVLTEEKKGLRVILIQALPRLNRLDTIIEKATELGASSIHLFPGEHSERKDLSTSSVARLKKIAQAAIKQSGHLHIPEIIVFSTLKESLPLGGSLFFGDVDAKAPLLIDALEPIKSSIGIVIGPESGLSEKEEVELKAHGAVGVKLSHAILRTDTAPIVALGLISHILCRVQK